MPEGQNSSLGSQPRVDGDGDFTARRSLNRTRLSPMPRVGIPRLSGSHGYYLSHQRLRWAPGRVERSDFTQTLWPRPSLGAP
jgi:hypothetical protein